jgi:hypothetical protein
MDQKNNQNYYMFNITSNYQKMIDDGIIGLNKINKDLGIIYNTTNPEAELESILSKELESDVEAREVYKRFMLDLNINDVVCLSDDKNVWAVGIVESEYRYALNKELLHFRKVRWLSTDKFEFSDGNTRLKIRKIENEKNIAIIEKIVNEKVKSDEEGLLINFPSKVSYEKYLKFFKERKLNPRETEILGRIFNAAPRGICIYELQKQYDDIDVKELLEDLSHKISKYFKLKMIDGSYTPNLFDGTIQGGHVYLFLKKELATALLNANVITRMASSDKYTIEDALLNSVYPQGWFSDAKNLLLEKKNIQLIGDWGTGKSYFAKRLANLIIENRDLSSLVTIKLHKSLTYNQLIDSDYRNLLSDFVDRATKNSTQKFVVIFEDTHEVDLKEVLGEVSYLIEDNNRDIENSLNVAFDYNSFYLPNNIYFIETRREYDTKIDSLNVSNVLMFEMKAMYNQRFVNMFEDSDFGKWLAKTYKEVNQVLEKYDFSINHGLFLKRNRGVSIDEYEIVLVYKILPILKRAISASDYQVIEKLTSYKAKGGK